MRRAVAVTISVAALACGAAAGGIFNPVAKRPAPVLAGTDPITGKHVSLSLWAGRALLVNLWGSWCRPCREEAPVLHAFLAKHPGSLLGIDIEDSKAGARSFQQRYKLRFPNIFDPLDVIVSKLKPVGTPSTYFLDRKHRIVAVVYEPATAAQLERGWKLATLRPNP
jgi:thiol-disulfide isomerase/thioredoxin